MSETRISNLRTKLDSLAIDGILIYQPENRKYLTGFDGSTGYVLVTAADAVLATDFRYVEQAQGEVSSCRVQRIEGPIKTWFPGLVSDSKVTRLGIEAGYATLADFDKFKAALETSGIKTELVPVSDAVENLRVIKDADEIRALETAARITDEALIYITDKYLRPGVSEIKLAWELEKYIRESGGELSFPTIVAAGPASAMAHSKPSDRLLEVKGPLVIDMGVKLHGYCADLTRTFWLTDVNSKFAEIYRIVLQAQKVAIEGIRPGMTGAEADKLARDYIAEAGYAEAFGHSLGHGLGMVVHENPRLGQNSTDILREGMVFTIEPGVYISGWGGIRIEDDAVLENGKVRVLTSSPK
ncbi:M24 family metallopeptidase [Dehalogenimonas etheniformans]|uniref:Aminopeptidase P family protein n=1 Tax=Dehalogenimonas etheniformans TaxID=1536648 RepID=A0A2P5P9T5_9CHLR|nr:aminopeptidase P family protein [Dehalogenimonas etheniformans]PPD59035.1 aminopeptidase P family protein [Dehalogenimonas etheniformans]QNT76198.1 aminopeptidase P family protein [Dehalogenimonas etheniformans]